MQDPIQFKGRKLVVATMHEKERIIAPLLEKHLGVDVVVPENFDTDRFGTFTGEVKRAGTQLEAARQKARAAMASADVDLAVSSEGSFSAHPSMPFIQSNLELVLLIDQKNGYEIRGNYRTSETNMSGQYVSTAKEALEFARKIGFPEHGVIVRKNKKGRFGIHKNIHSEKMLIETVNKMLAGFSMKRIFVESDMRAHKNPTRRQAIKKATEDLIKNIASLCPKCGAPGFVVVNFEKGLKCSLCRRPTDLPLNDIYQCGVCGYKEKRLVTRHGKSVDPQNCEYCNP